MPVRLGTLTGVEVRNRAGRFHLDAARPASISWISHIRDKDPVRSARSGSRFFKLRDRPRRNYPQVRKIPSDRSAKDCRSEPAMLPTLPRLRWRVVLLAAVVLAAPGCMSVPHARLPRFDQSTDPYDPTAGVAGVPAWRMLLSHLRGGFDL